MISENIARLRGEVGRAALKAGRSAAEIKIVAVTKKVAPDRIAVAVQEGLADLGENRVQELLEKQPQLGSGVRWHLIGHLQTNKVKYVLDKIILLHSLDSWRLAEEVDKRSREAGIVTEALVQVNVSGEKTKYGLEPGEVLDFVRDGINLKGISLRGLMTIAPLVDDPEEVRPVFRELRILLDSIREKLTGIPMTHLSMGMTGDYRVAVEEGASILRVGAGIFGERLK